MDIPQSILKRCKIITHRDDAPGSLRVESILPDDPLCEDCGKLCIKGRTVDYTLVDICETHWRAQCKNCKLWRDPLTNRYDIDQSYRYLTAYKQFICYRDK